MQGSLKAEYGLDTSGNPCYNVDSKNAREVNEMGMSDIQFKDNLRRDLKTFKHLKELLEADKKEEALEEINKEIERINASLQD